MISETLQQKLSATVKALTVPKKGILAADESANTVEKRFAPIGLENTEDNRRAFRELFFTAPGVADYISGVILFDETIRQKASNGKTFVAILEEQGIVPGIKVDKGVAAMEDSPEEKITNGLEGLPERLAEYVSLGARFCKWRAVITIGEGLPTQANILENARILTAYAKACQEAGLVPIVEPEVLMDGKHSREQCKVATTQIQTALFAELQLQNVWLPGLILKSNMVIEGKDFTPHSTAAEIAHDTIETFEQVVPENIGGIVFLSGGESEQDATKNLNEMHKNRNLPWPLTFSYARALQDSATKTWAGKPENFSHAQEIFIARAKLDSLATIGEYNPSLELKGVSTFAESQASQD